MRTLHRYILSNFLVTFLMAMAVLTFVMTVGLVFSSMKYIARGMSPQILVEFLWQSLPGTLSYSVPIAALVASLLVFSRLSSDSEISAMRSCGVSLWAIMRMPVLLSAFLTFACLWVNDDVSPDASFSRSVRRHTFKAGDITALIEPLEWFETDQYSIYVSERAGNRLYDLRVKQPLPDGRLPIDVIGSFCSLEIDTYWSFHAGVDNASFLRSHADNIVHLHVKDGVGGHPKALGEGECDLDAVLDAAQAMGMEWLIVENDDPVPTGFEDITRSLAYIKSKLK